MADLGEFGAELAAVDADDTPDTFRFHGHEFALPARVSSLPALRYAYNAQQVTAMEARARAAAQRARTDEARAAARQAMAEVELAANAGLYQYLRDVLPNEWERFETVAAEFGVDDVELLDVAQKIMSAVAARPTRRSSGSPAGPSPTGATSPDGSASPSSPGEEEEVAAVMGRAAPIVVPAGAEVATVTDLDRARAEILDSSPTVRDLVRSGG
jgi:hypothetical protein